MKVENIWSQIQEIWVDAKDVLRLKMQLTKMEYLDRIAYMCAKVFFLCFISLLLLLFLFAVAASLGIYVAEWLGSWGAGLAVSSLFLIIAILVVWLEREQFFIRPANRYFLRMFMGFSSRRNHHHHEGTQKKNNRIKHT